MIFSSHRCAPRRNFSHLCALVRAPACNGAKIFALGRICARKKNFALSNFFIAPVHTRAKSFAPVCPGARTRAHRCEKFRPGAHQCEEKITVKKQYLMIGSLIDQLQNARKVLGELKSVRAVENLQGYSENIWSIFQKSASFCLSFIFIAYGFHTSNTTMN